MEAIATDDDGPMRIANAKSRFDRAAHDLSRPAPQGESSGVDAEAAPSSNPFGVASGPVDVGVPEPVDVADRAPAEDVWRMLNGEMAQVDGMPPEPLSADAMDEQVVAENNPDVMIDSLEACVVPEGDADVIARRESTASAVGRRDVIV